MPVPEGLDGLRVDAAIARLFGLSRNAAADIVDGGGATVDGVTRKGSDKVRGGAWLEVELPPPPAPPTATPQAVPGLAVVHEDDDVLVVDKPAGVAAHPSPGYTGPTVVGGLLAAGHRLSIHGPAERQGIVHRLDAGTSGLMVVAKSERAYSALKDDFRERRVDKRYHALVQGRPDPTNGTIDAPIDRHPTHPYRFAVVAGGRDSVTHYETLEAFRAASLVAIRLETGRTHQIRVHFAALRHPCVGDLQYGADPTLAARLNLRRQWLHAVHLAFDHPGDGRRVAFDSAYAADLDAALATLRAEA
ncbi:MAG TPA: RluA family pseudouridine synthase [Mycobacteriales bacterium]|jgi:23S rRNA pseudouridine1911/1915/1917 synthase|nr:RluA family pseudouridine synthase [Mycobacteriales bacterium]